VEAVRPAVGADLPRIVELCLLARAELSVQRGGWIWSRREARPEPVDTSLGRAVDDAEQCLVVGELGGYVVGYGLARLESLHDGSRLGVVEDLYTEAPFRELGLGEAMMDELVAFCRQQRCVGVDSLALPGDRETKNFFEGFGLKARALLVHRSFIDEG
jgi:ribosomal protein S18 acetylase RimI-like enzyme